MPKINEGLVRSYIRLKSMLASKKGASTVEYIVILTAAATIAAIVYNYAESGDLKGTIEGVINKAFNFTGGDPANPPANPPATP